MTNQNLINCDGCGEQIKGEDALQCVGCLKYFCSDCASDIGTGVDIMHGQCKQCEDWAKEIMADCEQRKQELIVAKIKAAMHKLECLPFGNVGPAGLSREQVEKLNPFNDLGYCKYRMAQSAWLELNELLEAIA